MATISRTRLVPEESAWLKEREASGDAPSRGSLKGEQLR